MTTFATRLKQLREQAGISQAELATRAGLNTYGVAKLEQGVREPGLATAQAIARALGASMTVFDDVTFAQESALAESKEPTKRGRPKKADAPADDLTRLPIGDLRKLVKADLEAEAPPADAPVAKPARKPRAKKGG